MGFTSNEYGTAPAPPANVPLSVPDATATTKGLIQLSGMLGGTAASPTVVAATSTSLGAVELTQDLAGTATAPTVTNHVGGDGTVATMVQMTQAAYNALGTKDPNTLYVIVG